VSAQPAEERSLDERLAALFGSEPTAILDPFPLYRELREAGPVVEHAPLVLITRHAQAKAVLRDHARFSSGAQLRGSRADSIRAGLSDEQRAAFEEIYGFQGLFVVATDGDVHTRLRRIAHRAFTPRRIAALTAVTERYVDAVVSELAAEEEGDLMRLAYRVPLMIIGDLLGVPPPDRELIKGWSDKWGRNRGGVEPGPLMEAHRAMHEFRGYVEAMLEEHRTDPSASDLAGVLIGAEHGERLTPDELAGMFFVLLFAGHETTTSLIGTGMLELLRRREQWEKLCAEPSRAPAATEEMLRWVTPVQWTTRVANEDVVLAGTRIPAGTTVFPLIAAANRDPEVFAEPEVLDVTRPDSSQHLALGFGPHFCLGAALARLEGSIAYRTLASRFPQIDLLSDDVDFGGNAMLRRPVSLPVRLGPERAKD
jgi:cytochrome P450